MSVTGADRGLLIGYTRASRHIPGDLSGQVQELRDAGVDAAHVWTDWGLSGRGLGTPGRDQALDTARTAFARHHQSTTLMLTDWARFARSAGDLRTVLQSVSEIPITIVVDGDPYGAVRSSNSPPRSRCCCRWMLTSPSTGRPNARPNPLDVPTRARRSS